MLARITTPFIEGGDNMNLEERLAHLQKQMEQVLREGASQGDIAMYESAIAELVRINKWIMEQCQTNNRIYFEDDGRKYMLFKNTTGIDFRFFAMKVNVINEEEVDEFEVSTANWKAGKWARLYFDAKVGETNIFRIDANSIEYQVMNGSIHQ